MVFESLTYAGHSAIILSTPKYVVAIDPWLEGNPKCPEELKNPKSLDLILLTHGHADHASDTTRLVKKYNSKVAATYELAMILALEGVPQANLIPMNKGGTAKVDGLSVTLTHALHSSSYDIKNGAVYAGEACGVVVGDGTKAIYHAGDTAFFSDMRQIAEEYHPTISILPIGDRFTMGANEAAKAAKLLDSEICIPVHYGTFPILAQTADEFTTLCDKLDLNCKALNPGESIKL